MWLLNSLLLIQVVELWIRTALKNTGFVFTSFISAGGDISMVYLCIFLGSMILTFKRISKSVMNEYGNKYNEFEIRLVTIITTIVVSIFVTFYAWFLYIVGKAILFGIKFIITILTSISQNHALFPLK